MEEGVWGMGVQQHLPLLSPSAAITPWSICPLYYHLSSWTSFVLSYASSVFFPDFYGASLELFASAKTAAQVDRHEPASCPAPSASSRAPQLAPTPMLSALRWRGTSPLAVMGSGPTLEGVAAHDRRRRLPAARSRLRHGSRAPGCTHRDQPCEAADQLANQADRG